MEKENNIGIVVLVRYSSSRLPGKALMEINGKEVLLYIIERLEQVVPKNQIVIATSYEASDNPIAEFANKYQLHCHRGSLHNVAERFYEAASFLDVRYAVRINGDNIFLDTEVLKTLIDKATTNNYTFLSNVKNRTFPKGMSVEIVHVEHYEQCLPEINRDENYKEHVMPYLYEKGNSQNHYYLMNTALPQAAGIQLALDTPEDFERSKLIIDNMKKPHYEYGVKDIYHLVQKIENEESI